MQQFVGILLCLALSMGLASVPVHAAGLFVVLNPSVNSSTGTLTINGQNFGSNPVVMLNSSSFPLVQPLRPSQIVAIAPADSSQPRVNWIKSQYTRGVCRIAFSFFAYSPVDHDGRCSSRTVLQMHGPVLLRGSAG